MKKLNKLISIVICLAMVLSYVPAVFAAEGDVYTLVTDAAELAVGDQIIIVAVDADYAMSDYQKSNNRGVIEISKADNTVTELAASSSGYVPQILTLEAGTVDGTFALNTGAGYLYAASSSKNYLRTEETLTANSSWSISITDGVASVVAQGENTRATLQYNPNNGSPLFACYASASQSAIAIYKVAEGTEGTDPEASTPESSEPEEVETIVATIPEANEIGAAMADGVYTEAKYQVTGTITEVTSTTWGNMYIEDADGNSLYIYGLYSADGSTRYDAMETKPQAGDTITVLGVLGQYNGEPQMVDGWIQELVIGEHEELPVYEVVTAPEADVAYKFGMIQENVSTTDVYYLTGAMSGYYMATTTSVSSAIDVYLEETDGGYYLYTLVDGAKQYINMVVSGNYVNGAYEETASTVYTYDADSNTLVATVNGELYWFGTRNDKTYTTVGPVKTSYNGFYLKLYAEVVEEEPPVDEPVDEFALVLGHNELTASDYTRVEYTFTAPQAGTLYLTLRSYTCNGVEYGEDMLDYQWSVVEIDGVILTAKQTTLEVTEGQVVTFVITSDMDTYVANLNLSFEGFYEEPVGSKFNPIALTPDECPTTTMVIPAGGEVYYALDGDFYEHVLYVYGENAYIVYQGWLEDGTLGDIYVYAENGVVTYNVWEYNIRIGNSGEADATFELDAEIPLGNEGNPATLVLGDNVTAMSADMWGYYYNWTATEAGTLTVAVTGDSSWGFMVQNVETSESYYLFEDGDTNAASVVVNAGDLVIVRLTLTDPVSYSNIDGTLTVTAEFTASEGSGEGTGSEDNTLELGYNMPELTEGEEKVYTWTATEDTLFVLNMYSYNWTYRIDVAGVEGTVRSSADETQVHMTIVEVAAGEVVTLTIRTADGAADTVEFATSVCAGTAASPIEIAFVFNEAWTAAAINVDMPAGEYVFTMMSGAGMVLTVDGVVTEMVGDGWFDPITFNVNVAEAGVVPMTLTYPVGSYYNPANLELGDNSAEVGTDGQGYWYTFTAETDTLLTLTMFGDNWFYSAMIMRADGTYGYPDGHFSSETDAEENPFVVPMQVLELKAGDVVMLNVGTDDWTAGTVEFTVATCAGTAESPINIQFIFNEAWTAAAINVDMPAGEYVFTMMSGAGMVLTVDGVVTEMVGDGWFDPITFNVNVAEAGVVPMTLTYPVGHYYNPANLEMGYNAAEVGSDGQGYWYTFTAETDTLFAVSMYGDNWFYSAMIMRADGTYGYPDGHYSSETDEEENPFVVPVQVLELKAGDVVMMNIGTDDWTAATVEFNAMTYAGTAEDPVLLDFTWNEEWTAASLNADLPAGEYVYGSRGIASTVLTVNGVETEIIPGMGMRYPDTFVINSTADGNAVFTLELSFPVGSMMNPEQVEEGETTVSIPDGCEEGYFMTWTAPADGTLTVTVSSEGGWYFVVNNETAYRYGDAHWSDSSLNYETIGVNEGDQIVVIVNTYDPVNFEKLAGEIVVDLDFQAAQIVVDSEVVKSGDEVLLAVTLQNNPGITNGKITVNYDTTALEFVEIITTTDDTTANNFTMLTNGVTMNFATVSDVEGEIVLFYISLKVKDDAAEGDYKVGLTIDLMKNNDEEDIDFQVVEGVVTVKNGLLGDVNGDGQINTTDAKLIMQFELGLIDETGLDTAYADVNGDGQINTTDAKLIMQLELGLIDGFEA